MTTILAALAAAFSAAWGSANGLIRDQGSPSWSGAPVAFKKWKELSIVALGLPLALLAWWRFGPIEAGVVWAGMAGAWAMGHMGGLGLRFAPSRTGLSVPLAYGAMTLTGALVTLAPAGVLVWHGAFLWAALALLAGAAKVGLYEVAYIIRGLGDERPHAGTIGAMAHGAVLYAATAAAMVLA